MSDWATSSRFGLLPLVLLLASPYSTQADDWKSPDGMIAVSPPDPSVFTEVDPFDPFVVVWMSDDQSQRMGVILMDLPRGYTVSQADVESGFMEGFDGRLIDSGVDQINGYTGFRMAASGRSGGRQAVIRQVVVGIDNQAYKLMAVVDGGESVDQNHATAFIESLQVLGTGTDRLNAAQSTKRLHPEAELFNKISGQIGLLGVALLVVAVVILLSRRSKKPKSPE